VPPKHSLRAGLFAQMSKKLRGLIIGGPGFGKGTQSSRINKRYPDIVTISSGDILRSHIQQKTGLGQRVEAMLAKGELVPDHLISPMMLSHLDTLHPECWLLDGYPRTTLQAQELDDHLKKEHTPINFVIHLNVPWEVVLQRVEDRWIHAPSGRTYNLSWNPPKVAGKDDVTGEELTKRPDDCPKAFRVRLEQYDHLTRPVIEYYSKRKVLHDFKGSTSDEITPQIFRELDRFYG
jgi:adenylate kinase